MSSKSSYLWRVARGPWAFRLATHDTRISQLGLVIDHALPFNQHFYLEKKESGGVLFNTIRRRMLQDYLEVREK